MKPGVGLLNVDYCADSGLFAGILMGWGCLNLLAVGDQQNDSCRLNLLNLTKKASSLKNAINKSLLVF